MKKICISQDTRKEIYASRSAGKRIFTSRLSLNRMIITIILIFWIVPVVLIVGAVFRPYQRSLDIRTRALIESELEGWVKQLSANLNKVMSELKEVSYEYLYRDDSLQSMWERYDAGEMNQTEFYGMIRQNLNSRFLREAAYQNAVIFVGEEFEEEISVTKDYRRYQDSFGGSFRQELERYGRDGSTYPAVAVRDDRIYVMRNLYTLNFQKFGLLAVELDRDLLLQEIAPPGQISLRFYVEDISNCILYQKEEGVETDQAVLLEQVKRAGNKESCYIEEKDTVSYGYSEKENDYSLYSIITIRKDVLNAECAALGRMTLWIGGSIIPVAGLIIWFLRWQITAPVMRLVGAAQKLQKGEIGYQLTEEGIRNKEFGYLRQSFNQMSYEVEQLFYQVCEEEHARKDAQVLAMQAQISPHFLNNTLELMNWKVQMNGDQETAEMIRALSTLLKYGMGRGDAHLGNLSQEIQCADAYVLLIGKRYPKIIYQKNIEPGIEQVVVPRLIIQPLLENAVVHGIAKRREGQLRLDCVRSEGKVEIRVKNSGPHLSEEQLQQIQNLLSQKEPEAGRTSLGIYNVNRRIQLIYGEEYGLKIRNEGSEAEADTMGVVSILTVPYELAESKMDRDTVFGSLWDRISWLKYDENDKKTE